MYPISDTLKQLFLNGNKKCCKLTLNNATTVDCVITEADILSDSLTIDRYCSSGNKIEVGSAIAAELTLTLLNNDGKFNDITFEGSEVSLEIGIDRVEDSYIPCGKFTIDEPPRSLQHIKLRALDFMMLFDKKVDANDIQGIDTVEELLVKCCEVCNVDLWDEVAIKSLPNYDQTIKVPTADITYRQIIQWIAQLTGTCAFMDWDGKLRLSWFKNSGITLDRTNRYMGGTLDENNITIKGVCIKTQNTVVTTEDSVNPVVIESNQLLYSDDETYLEAIADNIATAIGILTYRPFQCNTIPMPFLYPLDIVSYEMKVEEETVVIPTVITNHNFGLNKASALSAVGETATQSGYSSVKGLSKAEIDAAIREAMKGVDAKAEHIHIKYSQYETGVDTNGKAAMTDKPNANTEYLGTCATNSTSPPDTPSSYKWAKIRGADGTNGKDGQDGKDGKDGKGISEVINYYLTTNKADGVTRDDFGGNTEIVTPDKDKPYLWNYEEIRYTSGNPTYTDPCIIGNFAENGSNGRGIKSITEYYLTTKDSSTPQKSNFKDTVQAPTPDLPFLWNYEKIIYTDGSTPYESEVRIIGVYGEEGRGVSKVETEYRLSTSDTSLSSDYTWGTDAPTWQDGLFLWTRLATTYTDNTIEYSDPVVDASWKKTSVVEEASKELNETLANALGLHVKEYPVGTSKIRYYHSNPSLTDSKSGDTILVFNSNGFGVCKTGWNNGNPQFTYGTTFDGKAVWDILTANTIDANLIKAGSIKSLSTAKVQTTINLDDGTYTSTSGDAKVTIYGGEFDEESGAEIKPAGISIENISDGSVVCFSPSDIQFMSQEYLVAHSKYAIALALDRVLGTNNAPALKPADPYLSSIKERDIKTTNVHCKNIYISVSDDQEVSLITALNIMREDLNRATESLSALQQKYLELEVELNKPHVHEQGSAVTENYVDSTCVKEGSYESVVYCTTCGEEIDRVPHSIAKKDHSYTSAITKQPTCTATGTRKYTCSVCGDSYTETIAATEHKDTDGNGYCDVCNAEVGDFRTIRVEAEPTNGGTVSGGGTYEYGTVVALKATPNSGYYFLYWTNGTETRQTETTEVYATSSQTWTAVFEEDSEGGEPTHATDTIVNGTLYVGTQNTNIETISYYEDRDDITKVVVPEGRTMIAVGCFYGCSNLESVTIPSTATFIGMSAFNDCRKLTQINYGGTKAQWQELLMDKVLFVVFDDLTKTTVICSDGIAEHIRLTLSVQPSDSGRVRVSGISGTNFTEIDFSFIKDSIQTFTAEPESGYRFKEWRYLDGDEIYTDNPVNITTVQNTTLTAVFEAETTPTCTVTVQASPSNGGTVTGGGTGFKQGDGCYITATPAEGWKFVEWQVTCNGNTETAEGEEYQNTRIQVFGDTTAVAVFEQVQTSTYTVATPVEPPGSGTVTGGGSGFAIGDYTSLTATANPGYSFLHWRSRNGDTYTSNPLRIGVAGDTTFTAVFEAKQQAEQITIGAFDGHQRRGSVTVSVNGVDVTNAQQTYSLNVGDTVTVTAVPNSGHDFSLFRINDGESYKHDNPYTFVVNSNTYKVDVFFTA